MQIFMPPEELDKKTRRGAQPHEIQRNKDKQTREIVKNNATEEYE